jgi:DegV family protein with EDD domain
MKHIIVSDSSCNIHTLTNTADDSAFACVPLKIRIGEKEFTDNELLNTSEMLWEMYAYKGKSSSSCPSPEEWAEQFRRADEVFALTITSSLSGSYNSAMTARTMVLEEQPDKKICIIDTLSTGPEMMLLIEKLNEYFKKGLDFDTICDKIRIYQQHTHLIFHLESLDNLVKNGRTSKLIAKMADVLNIHIVGCASREGTLEVLHKCRGANRSYSSMLKEMIQNGYSNGKVIISHCENEAGAKLLKSKIEAAYETPDIRILPTGGLCSFYAERKGILLGYESV